MTVTLFLGILVPLLVALDPVGVVPVFLSLTRGMPDPQRRVVGAQAVAAAFAISLGFLFVGQGLLVLLGVTVTDFQIAGGLILLVLAMIDLLIVGKPTVQDTPTIGIVPLAMPLIAGPATLTTSLVLVRTHGYGWVAAALAISFIVLLMALAGANRLARLLGVSAMTALSKLVMLLLAAIAVNYIRVGVTQVIADVR